MTTLTAEALVGAWRLVDWTVHRGDGSTAKPLGDHPVGLLVYTAEGRMSGQMMRTGRPRLRRDRATAADTAGTPEEIVPAFNGYVAYFGTYTVDAATSTVHHHVEAALIPNWEGAELVRTARLDGDDLILRTPAVEAGGRTQTGTLTWRRDRPERP
ncbi:lipocalin-like domain-containing protein [Pseudonocardia thermophila]|uniref:lipocalin-like domain-containing protein n=1 Tax=Pseudonocardia thermophila TaxID=1848 RepID=UPI00248F4261|nr:lipocalin-like domain-containing protein [Pseudonocardia thermophila]